MRINNVKDLLIIKNNYLQAQKKFNKTILVCGGAGCVSSNCLKVNSALKEALAANKIDNENQVLLTGCMGTCALGPVMLVLPEEIYYVSLNEEKVQEIVKEHIIGGNIIEKYTYADSEGNHIPKMSDIPFFKNQLKIALSNCGAMDYSSLEAYIARDGYMAIAKALNESDRTGVIDEVIASGLRGRGGAGFPTGIKWSAAYKQVNDKKYLVCNADEGDPGAFMDRSIIEGDPHCVIEGMLIGAYAIGANEGFVYVRAEYPLAIERLSAAIEQAKEAGLIGNNILGSGFNFSLSIRIGAGAFVCGEETALIASTEGKRGEPSQKPPFPFESGLFKNPTIINNVETFANIPAIILKGAKWFSGIGTEKSKGTKVFALAGNVINTGIVEVAMGKTLREMVYDIGGGIPKGKKFKAAQIGGPSGGCLTEAMLDLPLDYESVAKADAIMGSGGLIVMDEDTNMVDTARFFLDFIRDESCGKCVPCRIGTKRMLELLERIIAKGTRPGDIDLLIELGEAIKDSALCALGQTAPNPVMSIIKNFPDEIGNYKPVINIYTITDACKRCGMCLKLECPAIISRYKGKIEILEDKCTGCGQCSKVCKFNAIKRISEVK
ncbi:MAG: NADH-quinone oxidoreductase subunit NuoF [Christensenellales bacterium]|jgi:NADH-quinone oxidoreductase subunit F